MSYFPTVEEQSRVQEFIRRLKSDLQGYYERSRLDAVFHVVGSTAKGTFVSGEYDVDVYVMTSEPMRAYELAAEKFPTGKRKLGELLIWHFIADGFDVDLVFAKPGYVKEDTLKHAPFYNSALLPSQKREVVKAKAFFKTEGVYSAEVGGITGVAVEELIRRRNTLDGLCSFLLKQKVKPFLQDPVMEKPRDLLASVVPRRWRQIQQACREYLETRSFKYHVFTRNQFLDHYRNYNIIQVKRKFDKGIDYLTASSLAQHVKSHLLNWEPDAKCDFDVFLDDKDILVAVKITPEKLSLTTERCINKKFAAGVEGFKKAHPNHYEKNGYVCAVLPRKITAPLRFYVETLNKRLAQRSFVK